jgi:hypothetical protein
VLAEIRPGRKNVNRYQRPAANARDVSVRDVLPAHDSKCGGEEVKVRGEADDKMRKEMLQKRGCDLRVPMMRGTAK